MIRANTFTQAALEAAPDAILVVDTAGNIAWANSTCATLLGYMPHELCGKPVACLLPSRYGDPQQRRDMLLGLARSSRVIGGPDVSVLAKTGELVEVGLAANRAWVNRQSCVVLSLRDERHRSDSEDLSGLQYAALQSAANGVVITDVGGNVVWANPSFCRLTGYQLHEMVGRSTRILRSGQHDQSFYANLWKTILSGKIWCGEMVNRRKDGTFYHEEQTITPVFGPGRLVTHFIAIKQDVSERRRAEEKLKQARIDLAARLAEIQLLNAKLHAQAIRDPLTGLFNRRYFDETVGRELARLERSRSPLGIVTLDLDHFKGINDQQGHAFGDEVLRHLADTLRSGVRASDVACRFGGEEFVVAITGRASAFCRYGSVPSNGGSLSNGSTSV